MDITSAVTYIENMSNTTRNRRYWLFLSAGRVTRNPGIEIASSTEVTVVSKLSWKMAIHKAVKKGIVEIFKFAGPILTLA